ncbi:MAG: DNA polymerase III subunit gamma/tau [Victivallales bacterium]|nr:DNA polymerase III subunit gamma/tau [Victivallales bacterium]
MTSEYQVIARKWRPQRFADVVGQEHIVATLKNAIRRQRTAHAYLFVGPRGIGKTTTARIFAKALNCTAPEDGEPCCKCESCVAIANESSIDVIEIDAASQNSVDNIRELREEVMHVPVNSRYKIYIIDEVHMLSKQAWNALLKTVEEPPPHAKFIFATTEVHMVLPTIISRCQRFDLQRLSTRLIAGRLAEIAAAEQVNISPSAIDAIARAADGGMRDAQSLLDQMIAFFGSSGSEQISEDQVLSLFGLTAITEVESLVRAIFRNDRGGVVANIYTLAARGKNLETLFNDLLDFLRGIQLTQILANPETVLETGAEAVALFRQMATQVTPDQMQRLLETLAPVGRTLHDALNKQVYLETIILKAMRYAHSLQIDDLIARLNQIRNAGELEIVNQLPAASPAPATVIVPAPTVIPTPTPENAATTPVEVSGMTPEPPEKTAVVADGKIPAEAEPAETPEPTPENAAEKAADQAETAPAAETGTATAEAKPDAAGETVYDVDPYVADPMPGTLDEDEIPIDEYSYASDDELGNAGNAAGSAPETDIEIAAVTTTNTTDNDTAATATDLWQKMTAAAEERQLLKPAPRYYMREAVPESWQRAILTVLFDAGQEQLHADELNQELRTLQQLLVEISGDWSATVKIETRNGLKKEGSGSNGGPRRLPEELRQTAEANPYVQEVLDLFSGEIVDVHEK